MTLCGVWIRVVFGKSLFSFLLLLKSWFMCGIFYPFIGGKSGILAPFFMILQYFLGKRALLVSCYESWFASWISPLLCGKKKCNISSLHLDADIYWQGKKSLLPCLSVSKFFALGISNPAGKANTNCILCAWMPIFLGKNCLLSRFPLPILILPWFFDLYLGGKSAILTALCVAFGCRAKGTQRAATLKDFIKTGCRYYWSLHSLFYLIDNRLISRVFLMQFSLFFFFSFSSFSFLFFNQHYFLQYLWIGIQTVDLIEYI